MMMNNTNNDAMKILVAQGDRLSERVGALEDTVTKIQDDIYQKKGSASTEDKYDVV